MIDTILAITGVLGVVVAALSSRIRMLPVSVPLVAGVLLGADVSGALPLPRLTDGSAAYHEAARLLLAVSVMAVGWRYPIRKVTRHWRALLVLLAVVLPLMAAATAGVAALTLGVSAASAFLLGAALCPTPCWPPAW